MKASDIIKQLQIVLPTVTDSFSTQIALQSVTPVGTTATAKTSVAHNLSIGDAVNVTNTFSPIGISSITRNGDTGTATTDTPHDITEGFFDSVTISGANESEFNGTFSLVSAVNRKTFQFSMDDSGATVATGSMLLEDPPSPIGYNGLQVVTAIPQPDEFQYKLPIALTEPSVGSGVVHSGVRVTGAATVNRAMQMYTEQANKDDMWAFAVLGETIASKDRNSRNDAVTSAAPGSDRRQQIYQNFSIFVFRPSASDLSGRSSRDDMEDVMVSLFKALLYWKAPPGLSADNGMGVVFVSHAFQEYDTATYIQEFQFQLVLDISRSDTVDDSLNVAFRDIDLTMGTNLGTEKLTSNINLDDKPLPDNLFYDFIANWNTPNTNDMTLEINQKTNMIARVTDGSQAFKTATWSIPQFTGTSALFEFEVVDTSPGVGVTLVLDQLTPFSQIFLKSYVGKTGKISFRVDGLLPASTYSFTVGIDNAPNDDDFVEFSSLNISDVE